MTTLEEEYMRKSTLAERKGLAIGLEKGRLEGRAEGRAEGRTEGAADERERLNKLNSLLVKQNRTEDLEKSFVDKEFQQKLLEEFGL